MLSEKDILLRIEQQRMEHFLYSSSSSYRRHPPSILPTRLFSQSIECLEKNTVSVGPHFIDIISKNKQPSFFIWRTAPKKVEAAIDAGILTFHSLTSRTLAALGAYRRNVYRRVYDHGILSLTYPLKSTLLNHVQQSIKLLRPLERLINTKITPQNSNVQINQLIKHIENYRLSLTQHYQSMRNEHKKTFEAFIPNIKTTWQKQLHQLTLHINSHLNQLQRVLQSDATYTQSHPFSPTHRLGIGLFIKKQLYQHIRFVQQLNQDIAYSTHLKSLSRGDFHRVCEDALKVIRDHIDDLHNPVLLAHQGLYDTTTIPIAVNFQFLGNDQNAINETLMVISQLEGDDVLYQLPSGQYVLKKKHSTTSQLTVTRGSQWPTQAILTDRFFRVLYWVWNVTTGLVLGLTLDLVLGFSAGLLGKKLPSFAHRIQIKLKSPTRQGTKYDQLLTAFAVTPYSFATLVGIKLYEYIQSIIQDFRYSAIGQRATMEIPLWGDLYADYLIGHGKLGSTVEQLLLLEKKFIQVEATYMDYEKSLTTKAPALFQHYYQGPIIAFPARPPYELNDGEWSDIFNAAASGLKFVCDTITHPIHAQTPMLGLLFTASYALGLLALLSPTMAQVLPSTYLRFCKALGNALAHGKKTQALSAASLQAQFLTSAIEATLHGHDSWLVNAAKCVEHDSSKICLYATLAVSIGGLIAFKLNIPWLSEEIRGDLGTLPLPTLGLTGAKLSLTLLHILEETNQVHCFQSNKTLTALIENQLPFNRRTLVERNSNGTHPSLLLSLEEGSALDPTVATDNTFLLSPTHLEKTYLIYLLNKYQPYLGYLPQFEKRLLMHVINHHFKQDSALVRSFNKLLFPASRQSILMTTLSIPFSYFTLLFRCLSIPFTHYLRSITEVLLNIRKDTTRILYALTTLSKTAISFIRLNCRCLFDVIFNSVIDRANKYVNHDSNRVSSATYVLSQLVDSKLEESQLCLAKPLNCLKQHCTAPNPWLFFNQHSTALTAKEEKLLPWLDETTALFNHTNEPQL